MTRFLSALAIFAFASGIATAEEPKAGPIQLGDKAPEFKDLEGTDGEKHSLKDFDKDVLVICITCNHCPVAIAYEDRNIDFVKNHGDKVNFVAINVNNTEQDKMPKMIERAKEKGFNHAYLYDPSQKIARQLGAKVTPQYYVFNKDRELVYVGALDDSNNPSNAKTNYLTTAVEAALAGKTPETQQTNARGCGVKYEKSSDAK